MFHRSERSINTSCTGPACHLRQYDSGSVNEQPIPGGNDPLSNLSSASAASKHHEDSLRKDPVSHPLTRLAAYVWAARRYSRVRGSRKAGGLVCSETDSRMICYFLCLYLAAPGAYSVVDSLDSITISQT